MAARRLHCQKRCTGEVCLGLRRPGTAQIVAKDKKKVNQRVLCSRSGHKIILDDTDGKEQIIIQDKTEKNKIVIDSKKNSMTPGGAG